MTTAIASSQSATRIDVAPLRRPDHADYVALLDLTTDGAGLPTGVEQILALAPFRQPFTHGPALCMTAHLRRSANPKPVGAVFASFPDWATDHPRCQRDPGLSGLLLHTVICIYGLAVSPHRRRQGIARTLLTEAEDRARQAGFRLSTLIHKPELAPFYQRLGYTTARHITIVVPPDAALGTTQPHPFMTAVKPLAPDVHVRMIPGSPGPVVTGLLPGSDLPPPPASTTAASSHDLHLSTQPFPAPRARGTPSRHLAGTGSHRLPTPPRLHQGLSPRRRDRAPAASPITLPDLAALTPRRVTVRDVGPPTPLCAARHPSGRPRAKATPVPQTPTATETDRQVRRLYDLAYRTVPIARILANPQATSDGAAYATARIPRALSAARRLLTLPGVAEHEETPYALSFLNAAELQLNAPSTTLLRIAAAARKAAARADAADDDLRVVVYQDIEEHSRYLVDAAQDEPVLGRRGWSARDRAASNTLQQWAAHWGLTHPADAPRTDLLPQTEPVPTLPAHLSRQAAARAATRTRCAAGIRCTEPNCLTYGALKVTFPASAWLCTNCIPAVNTRLAAGGYAPDTVQPVPTPTTPATSSRCTTPPARAPIRWNAPARNVPSSSRRPNAPSTTPATRSGSPATEPHPHGPAPRTPVPVRGRTHARPCLRSSPASHRSSRPTRPAPRHRRPRTPIHTDRCQGPDMTNPTTTPEDFGALLREALGTNHRPTTQQECTLTFPLDKVRSIAELAIAARKHAIGPGDPDARPRLWWIKGDGTYLMSNGITNTPHTRDTDGNWHHIVYADNWGPDTDPSTVLGSDDLHETLDLTQPLPDGQILIDMLRTAPDHATRFLLHITHDDEGLALTMTTE